MGCCEATNPNLLGVVSDPAAGPGRAGGDRPDPGADWDRRTALKTLLGAGAVIAVSGGCGSRPRDGATPLSLAFCGQLLCVVPYEVTRVRGLVRRRPAGGGQRRPDPPGGIDRPAAALRTRRRPRP